MPDEAPSTPIVIEVHRAPPFSISWLPLLESALTFAAVGCVFCLFSVNDELALIVGSLLLTIWLAYSICSFLAAHRNAMLPIVLGDAYFEPRRARDFRPGDVRLMFVRPDPHEDFAESDADLCELTIASAKLPTFQVMVRIADAAQAFAWAKRYGTSAHSTVDVIP